MGAVPALGVQLGVPISAVQLVSCTQEMLTALQNAGCAGGTMMVRPWCHSGPHHLARHAGKAGGTQGAAEGFGGKRDGETRGENPLVFFKLVGLVLEVEK